MQSNQTSTFISTEAFLTIQTTNQQQNATYDTITNTTHDGFLTTLQNPLSVILGVVFLVLFLASLTACVVWCRRKRQRNYEADGISGHSRDTARYGAR